ncbi:hypothetical protein [Pseudofulvibacter geojedonensis]|uniref:Uncharacterized protein n=1 Tax=Pseudofulvibacter geojedonensis TaxID=1123758 RepID=A0ABW3HYQ5_9FLAO
MGLENINIECNSYVYFSFDAEYFDVVTELMGVKPTSFKIKREPVPKFTTWEYKI